MLQLGQALRASGGLATARKSGCPTGNIDVVIFARLDDMPAMSLLINSMSVFMPCYNSVHLVVDRDALPEARAWAGLPDEGLFFHTLPMMPQLREAPNFHLGHGDGYLVQDWYMFWGDKITNSTRGDFVMYLDTDSILANELTCRSLFDDDGRLYQLAWSLKKQNRFRPVCEEWLGGACEWCYMAAFPFTVPRGAFEPMRAHIAQQLSPSARLHFDGAVAAWAESHPAKHRRALSQFVIIGEYLRRLHGDAVVTIRCLDHDQMDDSSRLCRDYTMPGVHLGWRSCFYVKAPGCKRMALVQNTEAEAAALRRGGGGGERKFGTEYMQVAAEIVNHGRCLMIHLREAQEGLHSVAKECEAVNVTRPHPYSMVFMDAAFNSNNLHVKANLTAALDRQRPDINRGRVDTNGHCRHSRWAS